MRFRFLSGVLVALLLVMGVVPALAQDGGDLTPEQMALLDRVQEARARYEGYSAMTRIITGDETQDITISFSGVVQQLVTTSHWDSTGNYLTLADGTPNISVTASSNTEVVDPSATTSYMVMADARVVDGNLYVNAAYETPDPALPVLPEGWFLVDDLANYETLDALQLDSLIEDNENKLFDDIELVKSTATDVTVEADTLEDGTPVDRIMITFSREGLIEAFTAQGNTDSIVMAMFSVMSEDSAASLSVTMTADNTPVQVDMSMNMIATGVDANTLSPDQFPEGVTLDFNLSRIETEAYSQFDAPLEPATVPEELAQ